MDPDLPGPGDVSPPRLSRHLLEDIIVHIIQQRPTDSIQNIINYVRRRRTAFPAPNDRTPPVLTEHLQEEILVRIGAPDDLARASAACKAFSRLITDPAFIRRYRSLHPPLLLGLLSRTPIYGFQPADEPHPNAPAALAFAGAANFSSHHLPPSEGRRGWERYDVRDGRVLVVSYYFNDVLVSPKLALCDPLSREFTLLPPIPDDLLASLVPVPVEYYDVINALFDPSVGKEDAEFRVMCWMYCSSKVAVFVYSSASSSWTHHASVFWAALGFNEQLGERPSMCQWLSYAHGCLYWDVGITNKLVKLDIHMMEFTTVSLPPKYENRDTIVVEASEGRIGIFSLDEGSRNPLRYSIWQNENGNANECPADTTIPLPRRYEYYHFEGAAHGYIFVIGARAGWGPSAFFSLDIKTMKVKRVCSRIASSNGGIIPYFGFPPFLSPRRI